MYINDRKQHEGKFISTSKTKIGREALPNRLEVLNELNFDWLRDDICDT